MASLGGNMLPHDMDSKFVFAGIAGVFCFAVGLSRVFANTAPVAVANNAPPSLLKSLLLFAYSCFLKPHEGDGKGTQQDALESFYKTQAGIYDSTRRALLKGREDMLALVAAQLEARAAGSVSNKGEQTKRVWVDVRSIRTLPVACARLMLYRWEVERDTTLRPWLNLSTSQNSSLRSTWSTFLPHCVMWLASALLDLAGTMSKSFARMRGSSSSPSTRMIFRGPGLPSAPLVATFRRRAPSTAVLI